MIHPEVWSFSPPPSAPSTFSCQASEDRIPNLIQSHHFNHLVSVAIPDTFNVPDSISSALITDCDYYKVSAVPVSEFVDIDFLHNFILKGQLSALSINTRIDVDDCVCVTPSKKLILLLNKVAFEELGLEGRLADSARKTKDKFYVTIDLDDKILTPGTKRYSRILECLSQRLDIKLDFLIAWEPPELSMCPSSIAAYFHAKNYAVKLCRPKFSKQHAYNLTVPSLKLNEPTDVVDWLGAASHSSRSDEPTRYLSNYLRSLDGSECGQMAILNWQGFFTTQKVKRLFELLWPYVKTLQNIPWCSLHVQGFDDSLLTFSDRQHSYFVYGDNMFTIFMQPDQVCLVTLLSSSVKKLNKKKS